MANLAGRSRGELKTRGEIRYLLDSLDDSGQLLEAAAVGDHVIPEGALLLPLGSWSHTPFGNPNWRATVRGHLAGVLRSTGYVPTFWLAPRGRYTDPATFRIWIDYGEDAFAWEA